MFNKIFGCAAVTVLVVGCVNARYKVTATVPTVTPKPSNCEFQVVGVVPTGDFQEVGMVAHDFGLTAKDPAEFKKMIQAEVCRVGGDVVVAGVNGTGDYMTGSVLRRGEPKK